MKPIIHICIAPIYEFDGWVFEYHRGKPYGPWPLKKDGEPRARAGKKFYKAFEDFQEFPLEMQEEMRVN